MIRNMDLIRKILFKIEDTVDNTVKYDLMIEGYSMEEVAYHCSILCDGQFLKNYDGQYGGGKLLMFAVGGLTWAGHEFLNQIRSDTVWNRTKETINKKGLPMALDVVRSVATNIVSELTKAALGMN